MDSVEFKKNILFEISNIRNSLSDIVDNETYQSYGWHINANTMCKLIRAKCPVLDFLMDIRNAFPEMKSHIKNFTTPEKKEFEVKKKESEDFLDFMVRFEKYVKNHIEEEFAKRNVKIKEATQLSLF